MDIKERIARQMKKAGVKPAKVVVKAATSVASRAIPDRIAKQINRAKVEAAIAATKMPMPDYVYKEPRMPRAKETADAAVKRFLEDRIYDDIPMEKSKIDPSRIKSMADVRRVIVSEQPREYVIGTDEQVKHGSPTFGSIGMENLEGPGYSAIRQEKNMDLKERLVETPDEPAQVPLRGIKIDLSGSFGNVKELTPEPAPASEPLDGGDSQGGPVEMNGVQKQMLAAMRAQRNAMKF